VEELPEEAKELAKSGGYRITSQHFFVEEKNNGLTYWNPNLRAPTRVWMKKSAHVVFRRRMSIAEHEYVLDMGLGESFKIILNWGLFDTPDDDDESKVRGMSSLDDAAVMTMPLESYANSQIESASSHLTATVLATGLAFISLI
jgi:hypothetical protein